jgi:hypothetical protein
MELNEGDAESVQSPITLTLTRGGRQRVIITALDRAGNQQASQLEFDFEGYPPPIITYVSQYLILLDQLVVRGTAAAGDVVTILVDGQSLGQVAVGSAAVGNETVIVRVPWFFISDRLFRPGTYELTATATSPDGLVSVPTDPINIRVAGSTIAIGGRPLVTVAVIPTLAAILILLLMVNIVVLVKLYTVIRRMHRREVLVDRELHDLQHQIQRRDLTLDQVETNLGQIERDLEDGPPPARPRRPRKRR